MKDENLPKTLAQHKQMQPHLLDDYTFHTDELA